MMKLAAAAKQQEEFDQVATEVMHERWGGMSAVRTDAFVSSLMMVMVSELGDKTFFIAAVMAMKHPRGVVLAGALGALALMTVLSAAAGFALPSVLPRVYTHYASVVLFLVFGVKLLKVRMEGSQPGRPLLNLCRTTRSFPVSNVGTVSIDVCSRAFQTDWLQWTRVAGRAGDER